jgi:hypothetical protein
MDFTDLNRSIPENDFPLPYINVLVDNGSCGSMYSFMDDFSRYNHIKIALKDKEKMIFITLEGTLYYKVMPFGLKNARATY